jgi:hypothetical protein
MSANLNIDAVPSLDQFQALKQQDRVLCGTSGDVLPLEHLEPINAAQESERVERDPAYDPQFRYAEQDRDALLWVRDRLDALELGSEGVSKFFVEARDYLRARLMLRLHRGENEHWTEQLYPMPPDEVVREARRIVATPRQIPRTSQRFFNAEAQAEALRARIAQYGIVGWDVRIRSNISSTNTDPSNRLINLRDDLTYSMEGLKRLVVHEVDTHVLRAVNGYKQPYLIFAVGAVPSYLMTEEGMAVVNEERMGYIDIPRTRAFAGRVVAAVRALGGPFHDVYQELRDYAFSHSEAFTMAKRVKRGLSDTRAPGGYIKDQAYFWGRLQVEDYLVKGGDLSRLYVGKVALEHVQYLQELGLRPPRYLPLPYS